MVERKERMQLEPEGFIFPEIDKVAEFIKRTYATPAYVSPNDSRSSILQ